MDPIGVLFTLATLFFFFWHGQFSCFVMTRNLLLYRWESGFNGIELYWLCSVQFGHSVISDLATLWTAELQASFSITNSWSLLKHMSIELVMPSNHLILCCPLLLLPSIFANIRIFSNDSVLHIWWPKYWSFGFSISSSNEYSGLISFRMDWLDILAVQGTLKSISSSALSFLYGPTLKSIYDNWKTIALTRWTFVGKVMSLLFNMLSMLVIASLSRSKGLLISWLHSSSAVILESPKIKSLTVSIFSHLFAMKWWDQMPWS